MAKNPQSYAIWQQNRTVMPAGVSSLFRLSNPFPTVVKQAKGGRGEFCSGCRNRDRIGLLCEAVNE